MNKLKALFLPALLAVLILLLSAAPVFAEEPEPLPMGEKTAVTVQPGQRLEFPFTPESDGAYFFCQNGNALVLGLEGAEPTDSWLSNSHTGYTYDLTAGTAYILYAELPAWNTQEHTTTLLVDLLREAEELVLDSDAIFGYVGDTPRLELSIQPDHTGRRVQWSSSDETVARVRFGDYTGCYLELVGLGTAEITATLDGKTAVCAVTVEEPGIWMPGESQEISLDPGQRRLFRFTPAESGSYVLYNQNETLQFSLTDPEGAPVSQEFWVVGDTQGYRYTLEAGVEYRICLELWEGYNESYTDTLTLEQCRSMSAITLDRAEIVYYVNHTQYLLASTNPIYAMMDGILWESADPSIVKIAYSSADYCELSLLSPGTTFITATAANGMRASCTVTVLPMPLPELEQDTPAELELGAEEMLHVHFLPAVSGYYQFRLETTGAVTVEAVREGYSRALALEAGEASFVTLYAEAGTLSWLDVRSTEGAELTVTVVASAHDLEEVPPRAPTYEEDGRLGYFRCAVCGRMFHDVDASREIEDLSELVLPQLQPLPPTGDSSNIDLFVILLIVSGCGLAALVVLGRLKKDS